MDSNTIDYFYAVFIPVTTVCYILACCYLYSICHECRTEENENKTVCDEDDINSTIDIE